MELHFGNLNARMLCALALIGGGCGSGAPSAHAEKSAGTGGTPSAAGFAGSPASAGAGTTPGGAGGGAASTSGRGGAAAAAGGGGHDNMGAGGSQNGTGGTASGGAENVSGMNAGGSAASTAGVAGAHAGGAAGVGGNDSGGVAGTAASGLALDPTVLTGVRDVTSPAATTSTALHNDGSTAVSVTSIALTGTDAALFRITSPAALPASVAAGGTLALTLALATASSGLPAAPPQNSGATLLSANLVITLEAATLSRPIAGLVLTTDTHEPTLGQILSTLGYELDVGAAQDNANPNTGGTDTLPGIESGSDEIAAPVFQKAGAGDVTLTVAARFSPKGPLPFGWYPKGSPTERNVVGTMAQQTDAQTSDKARMVLPPVTGGSSFDPGTATFGVWVYTDQLSQKYDTGTASNGDYDYSEDGPNSPPNVHRFKIYPLRDASGAVPDSFLLAVEEAANGDYQDYVFVLGNAKAASE